MPYKYGSEHALTYYHYIRFMLHTGLRGDEIRRITTSKDSYIKNKKQAKGYYDNKAQLIYFYDQKNHEEVEIPLSTHAIKAIPTSTKQWIFEVNKKQINYDVVKDAFRWINKQSGINATGHDLRRTYLTIAESLNISPYTYKSLVGHKIENDRDITVGYLCIENDRMRQATQQISDELIRHATKTS